MHPVQHPICGRIRPPGSKSLTNRALITAALAHGTSTLTGVLFSRDTEVMVDSLRRLGLAVDVNVATHTIIVEGCAGKPPVADARLYLENSGTSIRFLAALCALGNGQYELDGNPRMRERPIGDLAASLRELGASVAFKGAENYPPLVVTSTGELGGEATIEAERSSQFLSALLMAAPCGSSPVVLNVAGELVSEPYVDMTLSVMQRFGAVVDISKCGRYRIVPQKYRGKAYDIEPDASAASYFFAAAAITGGKVTIEGLSSNSLQGDVQFATVLEEMGCEVRWQSDSVTLEGRPLRGITVDMNAISDTAQSLAAVAIFATGPTTVKNVAHMRLKETDRVAAVVNELRRLGQIAEEHDDGFTIHPRPVTPAIVETYDDHRMAMSFALVGLKAEGVQIVNPGCTAKTYPEFFADLDRLCNSPASLAGGTP